MPSPTTIWRLSLIHIYLMICSAERPMCIAGVFGGLDSGISDTTTDVFIESAYFNPVWVRKTAKRFGLNTDSSFRFERGVDPNMQDVYKRQVPASAADNFLPAVGFMRLSGRN